MSKPTKNIFWAFSVIVLLLGCNESHSPNLKPIGNDIVIYGTEGDSLQLVGQASKSLANILKSRGLYESDSLWFTISNPAQKEIPPPDNFNEVDQIDPHYTVSIGISEQERKQYLELEKQRLKPDSLIEANYHFWDFWIAVSESRDSILSVNEQW